MPKLPDGGQTGICQVVTLATNAEGQIPALKLRPEHESSGKSATPCPCMPWPYFHAFATVWAPWAARQAWRALHPGEAVRPEFFVVTRRWAFPAVPGPRPSGADRQLSAALPHAALFRLQHRR